MAFLASRAARCAAMGRRSIHSPGVPESAGRSNASGTCATVDAAYAGRVVRGPREDELPGARRFDDLHDLACWLAGARVYIGNDSGPTHLAAAVGTPVVALFGPSDPAVWAPRGPRVRVAAAPTLEAIEVTEVENLVWDAAGML